MNVNIDPAFLLVLHTIVRKEVKLSFGPIIDTWYDELHKVHVSSEDAKQVAQRAERKADLSETAVVSLLYCGRVLFVHIHLPLTPQKRINARMGESEKHFHSSIEEVNQAAKLRHSKLDAYGELSLNLPNLCAEYPVVEAAVEKTMIAMEENSIAPQFKSHSNQINELQSRLDAASRVPILVKEANVEPENSIEIVQFIEEQNCMAGYLPRRRRERLVGAFKQFDKNPASRVATIQAQSRGVLQRIEYRKIHLEFSKEYDLLQAHCRGALARRQLMDAQTSLQRPYARSSSFHLTPAMQVKARGVLQRTEIRLDFSKEYALLQAHCRGALARRKSIPIHVHPVIPAQLPMRSSSFRSAPQSKQIKELRNRVDAISHAISIIEEQKAQRVIK